MMRPRPTNLLDQRRSAMQRRKSNEENSSDALNACRLQHPPHQRRQRQNKEKRHRQTDDDVVNRFTVLKIPLAVALALHPAEGREHAEDDSR